MHRETLARMKRTARKWGYNAKVSDIHALVDSHLQALDEIESLRFQQEETQRELSHLRGGGAGHEMERW